MIVTKMRDITGYAGYADNFVGPGMLGILGIFSISGISCHSPHIGLCHFEELWFDEVVPGPVLERRR